MPKDRPASAFGVSVAKSTATAVGSSTATARMDAVVSRVPPELRVHASMWLEIRDETDRGAAILAASYLDDRLNDAIKARLYRKGSSTAKALLDPNGYLGQYAAKYRLAYCLGLYGRRILSNLERIGKIRNKFAHSKERLRFDDRMIADECARIDDDLGAYFDINPENPPRSRYLNAIQGIGLILVGEMTRKDQPHLLPPLFDD